MKLLSAKGLHNEGWLALSASLSILSENPLQLVFSLPKAAMFAEPKRVMLRHNETESTIVVARGGSTYSPILKPLNGVVTLDVLCSFAEINLGQNEHERGIRVIQIGELGQLPISFDDFLRQSISAAIPKVQPLPKVAESGQILPQASIAVGLAGKVTPKSALGQLERANTELFASGWAMSMTGESVTVQLSLNGKVVAIAQACDVRPDLVAAGMGTGRAGFNIKIPADAITQLENEIAVTVDGQPLNGSPKRLDLSPLIELNVEEARHGKIFVTMQGWPGEDLTGQLFRDGLPIAEVTLYRRKKLRDSRPQGHQGLWEIPAEMQDGQPHVYSFEVVDRASIVRSDAVIISYPEFLVEIEEVDQGSIKGWAARKDRAAPLNLALYVDDKFVRAVQTMIEKEDVDAAYDRQNAQSGFDISYSAEQSETGCKLELRDVDTGIVIAQIAVADRYETLTDITTQLRRGENSKGGSYRRAELAKLAITSSNIAVTSIMTLPKIRTKAVSGGVDVIIPIYGGSVETAECIESVLDAKNKTPSRVILVNDCSPDPLINDFLDALQKRGRTDIIIIRRKKNGGFSESVNIGMTIAGDRHVVLLNADTVVQSGWIDRLMAVADSDPLIGTVTPMSNNGEIVTFPYPCRTLAINDPALARRVDQVAAECNSAQIIDIPVAIGFCMLIRRECIDEIGLFDAALWGRGYGEEVDFCLKARAQGWRHVVAADTFVVHRGTVSFGNEKLERIIESAQKINERYPFYDRHIQQFLSRDPIGPARRTIALALIADAIGEERVLHVTHSLGGGTEKYVRDIAAIQAKNGEVPLVIRFSSDGKAELEVDTENSILAGFFDDRHIETYKETEITQLKHDIQSLKIKRIHLHAPFGVSLDFLDWLTATFPFNATIHDYAWICPRVTLTQGGGRYCGEPSVEHCDNCVRQFAAHPGLLGALNDSKKSVALYRDNMSSILRRAETIFVGAEDPATRLKSYGIHGNYNVTPHPETSSHSTFTFRPINGHVRVALFGAIGETKGYHTLISCAKYAQENALPITFILFGYTKNDEALKDFSNMILVGPYDEEDLDAIVQEYQSDISFFPNQWPETYSYTLSHSLRLGLWPLVTELGAPAERVAAAGFGEIVNHDESAELICNRLLGAVQNRAQYMNRRISSEVEMSDNQSPNSKQKSTTLARNNSAKSR